MPAALTFLRPQFSLVYLARVRETCLLHLHLV
jgi:hypothetical protein